MIQVAPLTFLALLLAHLLENFLFQWKWLIENEDERLEALLFHGLVHFALAWTCLFLFTSTVFLSTTRRLSSAAYCFIAHRQTQVCEHRAQQNAR